MSIPEEFRTAATKLREAALGTTPGPWRYHDAHLGHLGGHTATVLAGELNDTKLVAWLPSHSQEPWATHPCWANSMWAALVNPLLAEPLAGLLDEAAQRFDDEVDFLDAERHGKDCACGGPYVSDLKHDGCGCWLFPRCDANGQGCTCFVAFVDVARAINGTSAPAPVGAPAEESADV